VFLWIRAPEKYNGVSVNYKPIDFLQHNTNIEPAAKTDITDYIEYEMLRIKKKTIKARRPDIKKQAAI
jgi:hypothetical protein